jgi:hypothetical protein
MIKKQFHETLSFIDAVFDDKFRKEFIKKTKIHLTFGEKRVMDADKFDSWVEEWERKNK